MMKCAKFVGPFDPFRRNAPGRPPGSKHLWGPRLGWYTNKIGAFHHKTDILMLDPFGYSPLRLAPGRDLNQPY